jgi:hypothetical protein
MLSVHSNKQPKKHKKKYDGAGGHFKMILEESLVPQRNKMMDKFAQIFQWFPIGEESSSNNHATPFMV